MTAEDDDHFWTEGNTGQSAHQIWSVVMNYDSFPFSKILTSGLQTQCIKKVLGQRRDLASNCVLLLASCVTVSLCILAPAATQKPLIWNLYPTGKK